MALSRLVDGHRMLGNAITTLNTRRRLMSIELTNGLTVNLDQWLYILVTAEKYGWKPEGTVAPGDVSPDEWDGNDYFSNSYQFVTDSDARNLAEALHWAIAAMRDDPFSSSKIDVFSYLASKARLRGFYIG